MFLEEESNKEKLKRLFHIDQIIKKIEKEREKADEKRKEIEKIKSELAKSRDTISLLIDIRDGIKSVRSKKDKRISKKSYRAVRRIMKTR